MKKMTKIFIIVGLLALGLLIAIIYSPPESREIKIKRLNGVAVSLPKFNDNSIQSDRDVDGQCEEISTSSSLPAIRDMYPMSAEEFSTVKDRFIKETEAEGITWQDGDVRASNVFERDGKKYKLNLYQYTSPPNTYGVDLVACD